MATKKTKTTKPAAVHGQPAVKEAAGELAGTDTTVAKAAELEVRVYLDWTCVRCAADEARGRHVGPQRPDDEFFQRLAVAGDSQVNGPTHATFKFWPNTSP